MSTVCKKFGTLKDGREVKAYTMTAACGVEVTVLDFGGTLQSLKVNDRNGNQRDIICGYDTPDEYNENDGYCGALIGRYANRIKGAEFEIDGNKYILAKNNGNNTLHGGTVGFDKKIWNVEPGQCACGADKLILTLFSRDGEEGFPGNLNVKVVYRLSPEGELAIRYMAQADKKTVVNMTNHAYFNLSGYETQDVSKLLVTVPGKNYVETDAELIPTGIGNVEGTPFDFTKEKTIGSAMDYTNEQIVFANGVDHCFSVDCGEKIVWKHGLELTEAASVRSEESGIGMKVYTNAPACQMYTGNFMGGNLYKNGVAAKRHGAVCFEPGIYPDSPNNHYHDCFYGPGKDYEMTTVYRFFVK